MSAAATPAAAAGARATLASSRSIVGLGALVLAAILGQAAYEIVQSHEQAVRATEDGLDAQSRLIAEQTARAIQAIDVATRGVAEQIEVGSLRRASRDELHAYLADHARGLVQSDGLALFDIDGSLRAVSNVPVAQMIGDRFGQDPFFLHVRDAPGSMLQIAGAQVSPGSGRWIFPIGRRLQDAEGRFAGIVGAAGRVDYFQRFYQEGYPDPSTRVSLLHRNGTLLARHPPTDGALGRPIGGLDRLLPPSESAPARVRRFPSPIDGVDHFVALRLVAGYPLAVAVSREASAALAPWRRQAIATGLRTLALTGLAAGLLVAVRRQLRRLAVARAELETSEARYALAAAGSDDGIWDWDLVGGSAYESRRARELQGLPLAPEVQPLAELQAAIQVHPDDRAGREAALQAHLEGRTAAYEMQYRVRQGDGQYRWIRVRALCVRDAAGRPTRIAGSVSDVDARVQAELALRESEERYALASIGSNEGHWLWNIPAGQVYVSDKLAEIFALGSGARQMPAEAYFAAIPLHPEDRERVHRNRADHVAGRSDRLDHEFRIVRPDSGEVRWLRTRAQCFRAPDGTPLRLAGSTVDETERKRVELALRETEDRYALAMTGSRAGHWVWDPRTDAIIASETMKLLSGHDPRADIRTRRELFATLSVQAQDRERIDALSADLLAGRIDRADHEFEVRLADGSTRWMLSRAQRLAGDSGQAPRLAGVSVDVTERKRAEQERERLEGQLRQAQKLEAIGTLAGGIAHDFNNILSAILGYGEMALRDAPEGSRQRRHIDAALSAGQRAKSLVERILAFSRSGIGERVPVHVQPVIEEALDAATAAAPANVRVHRMLALGDAGVTGDATQLHQVVMNLVANALQAMRQGGELSVQADIATLERPQVVATCTLAPGRYVRLVVGDTGTGMAPALLERIFDPFFTTKEVGVGTGLGLSLVHGIVGDLGGGIGVESQPGAGSRFTVWLPTQPYVARPAASAERPVQGQGQCILLVDDEETLVRLGEEMLAELGYEPVGFASSAAALQALQAEPRRFDALLSDEAMPGMTGSELAAAARALRPDLPLLLMSGLVSPALLARARALGVREVLSKPLAAREIARALAAALPGAGLPQARA